MMRRKIQTRAIRDGFYIVTNGQTEKTYFNLLQSKKSAYDVKVVFDNADPCGLVQRAIKCLAGANQVWVVFDIDNSYQENKLLPALQQAYAAGIKVAFSNLAFEVWLISHFKSCEQELDTNGHKRLLDEYLDTKHKGLKYIKNDTATLKQYFIPYYRQAINNSKVVYQKRMAEHTKKYSETSSPKIWEWNSCTTVYKLVEALKLNEI